MLSRAADALYWMCRYAERAENVARFLDVSLQVALDLLGRRAGIPGPPSSRRAATTRASPRATRPPRATPSSAS